MNEPRPVLNAQLQQLLGLVEQYRQERCAEILDKGREQGDEVVRRAFHEARTRMHQAVLALRAHMGQQIASAEAQLQTRNRQRRQEADQQLLLQGWQQLHQVLLQRWQNSTTRAAWVEKVFNEATERLTRCAWEIEYCEDWPPAEVDALCVRIDGYTGQRPACKPQADIQAGVRICAAGACLDGTAAGLLADRSRIESLLLAEVHKLRDEI